MVCEDSVVAFTAAVACDCLYGLPYLVLEGREAKLWCLLLSAFCVEEPLITRVEVPQLLMMRATSKNLAVLNFFTMFCSFDFWIKVASWLKHLAQDFTYSIEY